MDNHWKERFLKVFSRNTVAEEQEFLSLVDQVENHIDIETARILMKSFLPKPDHGTQERVVSVLESGNKDIVVAALLEELPRLMQETPDWAEVLIGQEVDRRPEVLEEMATKSSSTSLAALRKLFSQKGFYELFPNSLNLKI